MRDVRLAEYPFSLPLEVAFRDLDALGHVNNAVFLSYFESARIGYWYSLAGVHGAPEVPFDLSRLGMIVVRAEVDFASPAFLGEPLLVGCRVGEIGHTSFSFEYRIVSRQEESESSSRLVASGRTVQVAWDPVARTKVPVSEELRRRIEAREGRSFKPPAR